ncbi:MAG: transcription elongation factor GreA [Psittacicella sp.]
MDQFPVTLKGEAKLRKELEYLKGTKRAEITNAIAEAREHGDLKENAEYHAAREQQGFCEARIKYLEGVLSNARVIDITTIPVSDKVIFGTKVVLENTDSGIEVEYQIVGNDEADIKLNLISVNSPIAKGLIGKFIDDEVSIVTPGGTVNYYIVDVKYEP